MAESRRQLINASSFFQREVGKFGGFRAKKSTISGESFKKGSSLGNVVGQESDVGKLARILRDTRGKTLANEKKISLLKRISNLRKDNQEKVNSPLLESLQAIAATVDSIRDTLIRQQDADEDTTERMRIAGEKADRDKQEKGLESKPKLLAKLGDKIIAPVMGIFQKIFNFLKTLLLGKFLLNFVDWFANPANQGKIKSFVTFIKDWWPALTAAVLLFGTGFGGLVTGLIVAVAGFIPKLLAAIATMNPLLAAALGTAVVAGGAALWLDAKTKRMYDREEEEEEDEELQTFNKGGQVTGSGNKDTVPAMLTPGEFVMSKGAVQQYGVDTLAGMNAAAGGTNKPEMIKVPHFSGGGLVRVPKGTINSYQDLIDAGIPIEDTVAGNMRYGSIRWIETGYRKGLKKAYQVHQKRWNISGVGGGATKKLEMSTRDLVNMEMGWTGAPSASITPNTGNTSISPGLGVGKVKDMVNMEGYKKPLSGQEKGKKIRDSVISSVTSNKYEVKAKTPKNTVVAYQQEVNKNQKQKTAPASGGNEIPSFDVAPIRDPLKMVTLQIVLF